MRAGAAVPLKTGKDYSSVLQEINRVALLDRAFHHGIDIGFGHGWRNAAVIGLAKARGIVGHGIGKLADFHVDRGHIGQLGSIHAQHRQDRQDECEFDQGRAGLVRLQPRKSGEAGPCRTARRRVAAIRLPASPRGLSQLHVPASDPYSA